jgi:hypothetical protein
MITESLKRILQCLTCRTLEAKFLFPAISWVTFSGILTNTKSSSACSSTMYVLHLSLWKLDRNKRLQEKRSINKLHLAFSFLSYLYFSYRNNVFCYTCLFNKPPEIDMQEVLKPKTGFTNSISIWILWSFVLILCVLNITIGLLESEFNENISI